jgi:hypothetical protein
MRNLKAIGILFAAILLFWLGMPGVAFMNPKHLKTPERQAKFRARWGEPWTTISIASADLNRFRLPIAKSLGGLQPIFRISQAWHLYRDGPKTIRRMEILVDGERVYRTNDSALDWRASTFRNRRIRPMAESLTIKPRAGNRTGLGRHIVTAVREDFPGATGVEIRSVWSKRGKKESIHHWMSAESPTWELEDHTP